MPSLLVLARVAGLGFLEFPPPIQRLDSAAMASEGKTLPGAQT